MAKFSKRKQALRAKVDPTKVYPADEALKLVRELGTAKFTESVDVAVNLGIDARKTDQTVRGSSALPHGTGKSVRVAVFAQGENANAAKAAGADIVGFEDLAESIKGGQMDFDVVIATPRRDARRRPTGSDPRSARADAEPKVGTVTPDVAGAVRAAKAGQVRYRTDKAGIVHCSIGNVKFEVAALKDNLRALLADLQKAKPAASKGVYLKRITVSSTMGPGIMLDQSTL
jgi:large subunit ribosomal protein L1